MTVFADGACIPTPYFVRSLAGELPKQSLSLRIEGLLPAPSLQTFRTLSPQSFDLGPTVLQKPLTTRRLGAAHEAPKKPQAAYCITIILIYYDRNIT